MIPGCILLMNKHALTMCLTRRLPFAFTKELAFCHGRNAHKKS